MPEQNIPLRRGFTQSLTEESRAAHPVVVGITGSEMSALALRRAADEAAHRSVHLHVITGGPIEETLEPTIDVREMHTISSILANPHVTVSIVHTATPEDLLSYCETVSASLLVVGCDTNSDPDELDNPATAHRLVDEAGCDVLVVHADEHHTH